MIVLLVGFKTPSAGQATLTVKDSIAIYTDSVFALMQQNSMFGDKVNWPLYKNWFLQQAKQKLTFASALPLFQQLFDTLDDKHGYIQYNGKAYHGVKNRRDINSIRKPLLNELMKSNLAVVAGIVDSGFGYIRLRGNNLADNYAGVDSLAQVIADSVCSISSKNIRGWIVDLRLNSGGNMHPMISGLQSIIGDGVFVNWIDKKNNIISAASLQNGGIVNSGNILAKLKTRCAQQPNRYKIAVLISEETSSSGEITALAFEGKNNVLFIGEKTAGFMTANSLYYLPFNSYILIAGSYESGRDNKRYDFITPGIKMVDGDDFEDLSKDAKVAAAVEWLKKP